jgi:hypothetical protein
MLGGALWPTTALGETASASTLEQDGSKGGGAVDTSLIGAGFNMRFRHYGRVVVATIVSIDPAGGASSSPSSRIGSGPRICPAHRPFRDTLVGEMPLVGRGDEDGPMTQDDGTSKPDPGTNAEGEGLVWTYLSGGVHPLSGGWHLKEPVELTFAEGRWQIRLPSARRSAPAAAR